VQRKGMRCAPISGMMRPRLMEEPRMDVRLDEIADKVYRLSTFTPEIAPPLGFTFNQYLIDAEEPLLFHTGPRGLFEPIAAAVERVMPVARLRWISFGHVEADECGSMNQWLARAPGATVAHGATACMVSLQDLADRPPRALADGEVLDLGGKKVRWLDTPHVPHAWESGLIFEETGATLFCGDLFTHCGDGPALTETSIVEPAAEAETLFEASAITPRIGPTLRRLAALRPRRLAVMHGSCFVGDCADQLERLAAFYEQALQG
jgi:flavorubredoxin